MITRPHRKDRHPASTASLLGAFVLLCLFTAGAARAQNEDALQQTLSKTRDLVVHFAEDYSYLRYQEDVVQQKLKNNDKVDYKQEMAYDSMIRMRFEDGRLRVDEQRLMDKRPRRVQARPLLNTYGFSTLAMVFHPYYESSFRFEQSGTDVLDGK